eukprot:scaffold573387_cov51-Prasinocladus_malaysianus.AAC.1
MMYSRTERNACTLNCENHLRRLYHERLPLVPACAVCLLRAQFIDNPDVSFLSTILRESIEAERVRPPISPAAAMLATMPDEAIDVPMISAGRPDVYGAPQIIQKVKTEAKYRECS